jgi:FAD/FMN-containing dehydrogenase
VSNTPAYTFVPTTVLGLQNLVLWAKTKNKRIRAAGYRHSWTPLFSEDDEILVSMLDVAVAESVPDPTSLLPEAASNESNEFKVIQLNDTDITGSDGSKRLVRVGAAVTNEELRRWSIAGNAWTLPYNTIVGISSPSHQEFLLIMVDR